MVTVPAAACAAPRHDGQGGATRCVQVVMSHATFGVIIRDGRVIDAAPIARWTIGKDERQVAAYFKHRGARFRIVP